MQWACFVGWFVQVSSTNWRWWTTMGPRAITATLAAGVVGILAPSLIGAADGERRELGAGLHALSEAAAGKSLPAAVIAPRLGGPGQAAQGRLVGREVAGKRPGASQASQPRLAPIVPVTGRIVDEAGRPVAGAAVRVIRVLKVKSGELTPWIHAIRSGLFYVADNFLDDSSPVTPQVNQSAATTDAQGRLRLEGFRAEQVLVLTIEGPTMASAAVRVLTRRTDPFAARGFWFYGADFTVSVSPMRPVEGIVRDAKTGQPVAGVEIRTNWASAHPWEAWENLRTTTDAQGRFRLLGLSKEWEDPLYVVPKGNQPYFEQCILITNAAGFDLRLMSSLDDVHGVPKDGKNLVIIAAMKDLLHFRIIDAQGRMVVDTDEQRLAGRRRRGQGSRLLLLRMIRKELPDFRPAGERVVADRAAAPRNQVAAPKPPLELTRGAKDRLIDYVAELTGFRLPEPPAGAPAQLNIDLDRGIWIEGKVTDKASGRPVAGVILNYTPFVENPYARELPEFFDLQAFGDFYDNLGQATGGLRCRTGADGTYQIVGLPGRGVVGVHFFDMPYLQQGYGRLDAAGHIQIHSGPLGSPLPGIGHRLLSTPFTEINPPEGAGTVRADFQLVPGANVRLRVVDPQGQPVAGVEVACLMQPDRLFTDRQASADFDVPAFGPNERRMVMIRHDRRKLGRVVDVRVGDDKNGRVVVALEPLATIVGRVTRADGKPGSFLAVRTNVLDHFSLKLGDVSTDGDGKFIVPDVPVGCGYNVQTELTSPRADGYRVLFAERATPVLVNAGQATDAGEIRFESH